MLSLASKHVTQRRGVRHATKGLGLLERCGPPYPSARIETPLLAPRSGFMCLACGVCQQLALVQPTQLSHAPTSRRGMLQVSALMAASALSVGLGRQRVSGAERPQHQLDETHPTPADGPAEWLFEGGTILTMDPVAARAEAVAVRGRSIVYVGARDGADAWVGPATRLVDLRGRMLIPGLVDSHVHPLLGTVFTSGFSIDGGADEATALEAIAARVKEAPDKTVYFGFGWSGNLFSAQGGPHRRDLDAIMPDKPMLLIANDGHAAWANTRALEAVGIDATTPDPAVGGYSRDQDGQPTGYIREAPAMIPVIVALGGLNPDTFNPALTHLLDHVASLGFTTVFDAGMPFGQEQIFPLLESLDQDGRLPVRLHATHAVASEDQVADAVATLQDLHSRFGSTHFEVSTLKIIGDGVIENRQAAMLEPYQEPANTSGRLALGTASVAKLLSECDAAGFDVHYHTIGDASARQILDAIDTCWQQGKHPKVTLAHVQVVDDADQARMGHLKPLISSTGIWCIRYQAVEDAIGADRYRRMFRFGTLKRRHGLNIALGSDWPATYAGGTRGIDPFLNIQAAVRRQAPPPLLDELGASVGPGGSEPLPPHEEALDVDAALEGYTIAGARQLGIDAITGSIEVGKRADLAVIDRDITAIPTDAIYQTRCLLTLMDGIARYDGLGTTP